MLMHNLQGQKSKPIYTNKMITLEGRFINPRCEASVKPGVLYNEPLNLILTKLFAPQRLFANRLVAA